MKNLLITGLLAWSLLAQAPSAAPSATPNAAVGKLLDQIVQQERAFLQAIRTRTPLVETYIQETPESASDDARPTKDHYFLGRFRLSETVSYESLVERSDAPPPRKSGHAWLFHSNPASRNQGLTFLPRGFAQMAAVDLTSFDRRTYSFDYVRREFLGEVRCFVFDVAPVNRSEPGRFLGRIWVEDRDNSIVRFNGTYINGPTPKGALVERYFHFDSWRVNAGGHWVPAQIYIEEEGAPAAAGKGGAIGAPRFKAQTRIWDYAAAPANKLDELTSILIESPSAIHDPSAPTDTSPLESQRSWERQAEDNLIARLEKGGLLAPRGAAEEVLDTVINNLIVSAKLNVDAHCRILLTTPLETFSIGHTIAISRGLIDVLPDETSLALMLADELAHIALGHRPPTQFAFHNQTMLSDAELLRTFHFQRSPEEMLAAGRKTIEIMRASPYQKTANAGLFLKALAGRSSALPRLLQANLGNQVANPEALARLAQFTQSAPALEENRLEQIAALPLGSRVKVDPWSNRVALVKTRPVALLSPREKMPFEVTPFVLYLTRAEPAQPASGTDAARKNPER
jgi:hypothetical protein